MTYKLNQVGELEGIVTASALLSPHNIFGVDNDAYRVHLQFPTGDQVKELLYMFNTEGPCPQGRSVQRPWMIDHNTVAITSLIKPRCSVSLDEELHPGTLVLVRFRPEVVELEEAVIQELRLVLVDNSSYGEDWDTPQPGDIDF